MSTLGSVLPQSRAGDMGAWGSEGSEDRAFWALLNETPEQSGGHRSLGVCGKPRGSHCTYQLFASPRICCLTLDGPLLALGLSLPVCKMGAGLAPPLTL